MAFETGDRKPETGELKRGTKSPGKGRRGPHLMSRGGGCRPARPISGFRSLVSGLDPFAGIPLRSIRGRLGDRVYKTYGDKIIVTRVPCFVGYVPTAAQRERREKLRAATAYAQAVYSDPAAKAIYVTAAKQLGRQPFRLAVSDFLRGRPRVRLGLASKPRQSAAPANGIKASKPREDIGLQPPISTFPFRSPWFSHIANLKRFRRPRRSARDTWPGRKISPIVGGLIGMCA
jgi:hypothetical protein